MTSPTKLLSPYWEAPRATSSGSASTTLRGMDGDGPPAVLLIANTENAAAELVAKVMVKITASRTTTMSRTAPRLLSAAPAQFPRKDHPGLRPLVPAGPVQVPTPPDPRPLLLHQNLNMITNASVVSAAMLKEEMSVRMHNLNTAPP